MGLPSRAEHLSQLWYQNSGFSPFSPSFSYAKGSSASIHRGKTDPWALSLNIPVSKKYCKLLTWKDQQISSWSLSILFSTCATPSFSASEKPPHPYQEEKETLKLFPSPASHIILFQHKSLEIIGNSSKGTQVIHSQGQKEEALLLQILLITEYHFPALLAI